MSLPNVLPPLAPQNTVFTVGPEKPFFFLTTLSMTVYICSYVCFLLLKSNDLEQRFVSSPWGRNLGATYLEGFVYGLAEAALRLS